MQMREAQGLVRTLLGALALTSSLTAYAVFSTPGSFEVSPDGSASYSVPIQVPPGTAGMSPKLSLNYNSGGGNGILGMGWGIDGLSQISRCPKTMAQDGVRGAVKYNADDRFCLDGQRLIAKTDTYNSVLGTHGTTAAYGVNENEYRTELANFSQIISYGGTASDPGYFKVKTKGGQIIEYGNTPDSRIEVSGKTIARLWGVNKISDTKGNYITVSYIEDSPNGEAYVSRLNYTGNTAANLSPYASVRFTYETRADTSIGYQAGSKIKSTQRITNIKTYTGETLVKDYRLTYEMGTATQRSRLKTITECDGNATPTCLQPTTLAWQDAGEGFEFSSMQYYSEDTPFKWKERQLGDVNGDGFADLVLYNDTATGVYWVPGSSTGFDFSKKQYYSQATPFTWKERQLGDVNGDGFADLVLYNDNATGVYWVPGSATGFDFAGKKYYSQATPFTWKERQLGDVNGDGKADLVLWDSASYGVYLIPGSTTGFDFNARQYHSESTPFAWTQRQLGDINGDGNDDLILWNNTSYGVYVVPSNGIKFDFSLKQYHSEATPFAWKERQLGDVNGDGKGDLILWNNASFGVYVVPSNGTKFEFSDKQYFPQATPFTWKERSFADVNGDGKLDMIFWDSVTYGVYLLLAKPGIPDLISTLTTGLGSVMSITYKPLTDSTVYTKTVVDEAASIYPKRDIQAPVYVVSSVTSSDGIGGVLTTNYTYAGLKVDLNGRGSLGFRKVTVSNPAAESDSLVTSYYRQDYPYIGLPQKTEKRLLSSPALLAESTLTYANTNLPIATDDSNSAISKFPYVSQSIEKSYELDGSLISTTTTSNQYDAYGNVTQVSVSSNDGYVKTTNNLYNNDITNWLLGRLTRSEVTSTAP